MKKIIILSAIAMAAISCEIQQPNGPKVSDKSLKEELSTLCMFATVEPIRALEIIIEQGDKAVNNDDLDIGQYTHPVADKWQLIAQWWEGGPDRQWLVKATSPISFMKGDDGSWIIDYQGDGMEYAYYTNLTYKTVAIPIEGGWKLSTTGKIIDTDGYAMDFGTDDNTLITRVEDNGHYKEWYYSLTGPYSLTITKNGEIIDQVSGQDDGKEYSVQFYIDYLHYSVGRFYAIE